MLALVPQIIGRGLAPPDRLRPRVHMHFRPVEFPSSRPAAGLKKSIVTYKYCMYKQVKPICRNNRREARTSHQHQPWEASADWRAPFPVPGQ